MNSRIAGVIKRCRRLAGSEEGLSLVEMTLSCLVLIPVLFGIVQLSIGLYCYHYAADAAREASRWAMVRGSTCNTNFNAAYCSPSDGNGTGATQNDISTYVTGLGYPYSGHLVTNVQWCPVVVTAGPPATSSWPTCSTTQAGNNTPGNQVQVQITYAYPLVVPLAGTYTINLHSTSSMVIVQ
jgi:Flp pilus assembly protein TadG